MNPVVLLFAFSACLATLVAIELRPENAVSANPAIFLSQVPAGPPSAPPVIPEADSAALANAIIARPLFSQTRRPINAASPTATALAIAQLPRVTAILIDGPRRRAIFAAQGGKLTIVAEGSRYGPFTVQTIKPQQIIVLGPEGTRTVSTSFDPDLPLLAPLSPSLGAPQFPGALPPGAPAVVSPLIRTMPLRAGDSATR